MSREGPRLEVCRVCSQNGVQENEEDKRQQLELTKKKKNKKK